MILPTKHINVQNSVIGISAFLLTQLEQPQSISSLWDNVREVPEIATFERFTLALDLLYMIGAIEYTNNRLRRVK